MTITPLGKELRKLRIDRDERLLEMAALLQKSTSFISAIERGTKAPPAGFEELIVAAYDLSDDDAFRICRAADLSRQTFTIKPESAVGRDAAGLLARKVHSVSDTQWAEIRSILDKDR